jgi:hypothetical protein
MSLFHKANMFLAEIFSVTGTVSGDVPIHLEAGMKALFSFSTCKLIFTLILTLSSEKNLSLLPLPPSPPPFL